MTRPKSSTYTISFRCTGNDTRMPYDVPYYTGLAASTTAFGGNAATVVFLEDIPSDETLFKISTNLNQPMTIFLSNQQSTEDPKLVSYDVRFIPPSGTHETRYP